MMKMAFDRIFLKDSGPCINCIVSIDHLDPWHLLSNNISFSSSPSAVPWVHSHWFNTSSSKGCDKVGVYICQGTKEMKTRHHQKV